VDVLELAEGLVAETRGNNG